MKNFKFASKKRPTKILIFKNLYICTMNNQGFEWDEVKNRSNSDKHGVDFKQATIVFEDENKILSPDNRKDYGEERFKVVGMSLDLILSAIYTVREDNLRIISARAASKKEREEYEKNNIENGKE